MSPFLCGSHQSFAFPRSDAERIGRNYPGGKLEIGDAGGRTGSYRGRHRTGRVEGRCVSDTLVAVVLCRDAAPIDLCRDAAPIDLCRDAAPIDLYRVTAQGCSTH